MPNNDRQLSTHIYVGYVLTIFFLCIFWCWYNRKHKLMINILCGQWKIKPNREWKMFTASQEQKMFIKMLHTQQTITFIYIHIYIYTYIYIYIYIYISSNCNYCLSFSLALSLSTDYYLSKNVFCSPFLWS